MSKKKKEPTAGPVVIRKPDGTVEQRPPYSESKLKQIIGHDRDDAATYGKRKARQVRTEPD
jgi:hypothetical protein